jgi:hypothetical protein
MKTKLKIENSIGNELFNHDLYTTCLANCVVQLPPNIRAKTIPRLKLGLIFNIKGIIIDALFIGGKKELTEA